MYITIETLKHLYKRKTISRFRWISLKISFWTWRYRSCKAEDDSAITWSSGTIIHYDCDDRGMVVIYIHQKNEDDIDDDNEDNNDDDNDDETQCVPQYYHGGFPQCL